MAVDTSTAKQEMLVKDLKQLHLTSDGTQKMYTLSCSRRFWSEVAHPSKVNVLFFCFNSVSYKSSSE